MSKIYKEKTIAEILNVAYENLSHPQMEDGTDDINWNNHPDFTLDLLTPEHDFNPDKIKKGIISGKNWRLLINPKVNGEI